MPVDPVPTVHATADWAGRPERGSPWLLRIMAFLSLALGRQACRPALVAIAAYFFFFAPVARRESRRYLRRALGREPALRERFRHFLFFATAIHDRVYLIDGRYDDFVITVEGESIVRERLTSGDGAFLMGAHLGSFEVIGSVGRRQPGLQVAMAMYEENARKINAILGAIKPAAMPRIISLGRLDAMLRIADALDGGAFVGVLADRTLGDEAVQPVTLLDDPATLPLGPMRAAALLRRPVIFMAGLYRGANRYHVVFETIADFRATAPRAREAAVREAVARYAVLLERHCRGDPFNWFNFFDFWHEHGGPAA